jgi:hypothetical protein
VRPIVIKWLTYILLRLNLKIPTRKFSKQRKLAILCRKKKRLFSPPKIDINTLISANEQKNADHLDQYGICFPLYKYIDNTIYHLLPSIYEIIDTVRSAIPPEQELLETPNILIQKNNKKLESFSQLVSYHKMVANIRQSPDLGMVDVFNIDKALSNNKKYLINLLAYIDGIVYATRHGSGLKRGNINLYYNHGITLTRGLHVDNMAFKPGKVRLKAFIYLCDVSLEQGPYCYIPGSHKNYKNNAMNYFYNFLYAYKTDKYSGKLTDMPLYEEKWEIPCTGSKGTIIISDQMGVHRGYPQGPNATRLAIVVNYI